MVISHKRYSTQNLKIEKFHAIMKKIFIGRMIKL